jgi:predicted negative regulator of RcsB-dependent stress response
MLDAVIAKEKKDYPRALESITRSILLRERAKEPRRIADALELRGDIHLASGNAQAASVNYKDSHAIYKSIGSEAGVRKLLDKLNKVE